ncbi:hypothetical protein Back2_10120 [Nocardioides baekrokdamisoli]|uniref:Uncharacterized protein n=1 Tax=Nocardioides baekrokdamisoli TaxID=1804624 RepID=A0A3G9IKY2_9ACTN|nr:hypothetical protein [Nocardioides baekrokdamisoli]BBH16725.1 hypothetical protein Back2_10120 [Nocardioides baekrokdamisoli]
MRRLVIAAVVVAALAFGGTKLWQALSKPFGDILGASPQCTATIDTGSASLTPEQTENAAVITAVAVRRGLPARAVTIALATAMQESKLRNLNYGDSDSLGLFQQRPSMGWGTAAQITNPVYSANAFYNALIKIQGYQTRPIGEVAQAVQHSADVSSGPSYAQHEQDARAFASTMTGYSPHGLNCQLETPTTSHPKTATAEVDSFFGAFTGTALTHGTTATFPITGTPTQGWSVAAYLVAQAQRIGILQVSWDGWSWTPGGGWKQSDASTVGVVALMAG